MFALRDAARPGRSPAPAPARRQPPALRLQRAIGNSHAGFLWWGSFIDEGVTQLFADRLLEEHGLSKVTNHNYGPQLACAEKLVSATSLDMVARAYFLNDGELRETLRTRFNLTLHQMVLELQAEKFCARL